jgi:hypothetical protein
MVGNVEVSMSRKTVNRICAAVPRILSLMACVWVLGNVAGGARTGSEGLGFHVFWLLIAAQLPFGLGYLATADWNRQSKVATSVALQFAALLVAFAPVAYFNL